MMGTNDNWSKRVKKCCAINFYNSSGVALKTLYGALKNGDLLWYGNTTYITTMVI